MARGKNTPALFEVIRNAQEKQKQQAERERQRQEQHALAASAGTSPAAQLLKSPVYWFKGKHAHDAAAGLDRPVMRETPQPAPAATPAVAPQAAPTPAPVRPVPAARAETPPAAPATPVAPAESAATLPTVPADFLPPPAPAAATEYTPHSAAAEAARLIRQEMAADFSARQPTPQPQPFMAQSAQEAPAAEPPMFSDLPAYGSGYDGYDSDFDALPADTARSVTKTAADPAPFSYTTAIISAFAVLVTFGVVYIAVTAGRGTPKAVAQDPAKGADATPATPTQTAQTPKDVRTDVLNVRTPQPSFVANPTADDGARANLAAGVDSVELEAVGKPVPVPTNVKRVVGQQYLVLLSFPREEDAKDLVKFLAQNGVPATAERALTGYAKSWTSVVSVRSFDRTKNNPAYDRYAAALTNLLQKYAGGDKFRRTFKIDVYKWRTAR